MQVINAGFPRTGTQSLKKAFEILGLRTYAMSVSLQHYSHLRAWRQHARGEKPFDFQKYLGKYDATAGIPCCLYYKDMLKAFPDAKVVLCVRDEESWYKSLFKLTSMLFQVEQRLGFLPRIRAHISTVRAFIDDIFDNCADNLDQTKSLDKANSITVFNQGNQEIIDTIPRERLLVYRMGDGWQPLCEFLDVPIPDIPFPHANKNESEVKKAMAIANLRDLGYLLAFGILGIMLLIGVGFVA